jgi:DNA-binding CsgD family transcriptional regulator
MKPNVPSLLNSVFFRGTADPPSLLRGVRFSLFAVFLALGALTLAFFGIVDLLAWRKLPAEFPMAATAGIGCSAAFALLLVYAIAKRGPLSARVIATALYTCLLLSLAYMGVMNAGNIVWIVLYPMAAIFVYGYKTGLCISLSFLILCYSFLFRRFALYPDELKVRVFAIYALITAASFGIDYLLEFALFTYADTRVKTEGGQRQRMLFLDRLGAGGASAVAAPCGGNALAGATPEPIEAFDDASYEQLYRIMGELISNKNEFFVLYRKGIMNTLNTLPEAGAIFSLVLLESLGDSELIDADIPRQPRKDDSDGEFVCKSMNVEEMFAKAEAIIEFREAKKGIEFNKIQSKIDGVFSHDNEAESDSIGLDKLCAKYNISEREAEVAKCILQGQTNKEISKALFISIETVKTHVKNLLKKCGINSRIDFIKLFTKIQL